MLVSPEQISAARGLLRWKQEEFARRAQLSIVTVRRIESPGRAASVAPETCLAVQRVLENAGIEFIEGGVRLCHPRPDGPALLDRLRAIAQRSASRQSGQGMTEADLYDESGLPV